MGWARGRSREAFFITSATHCNSMAGILFKRAEFLLALVDTVNSFLYTHGTNILVLEELHGWCWVIPFESCYHGIGYFEFMTTIGIAPYYDPKSSWS